MSENIKHTSGNRALAAAALTVVAGTGLGIGAVAAFGHPLKVDMSSGRKGGGGGDYTLCSRMYHKGNVYLGGITNHGNTAVTITSVSPSSTVSGLRVTQYVVGADIGRKIAIGAQQQPQLTNPHVVPAHSTADFDAMVAGGANSKTAGFNVTLSNGHAESTDHLDVGMAFNKSACWHE